MRAGGRGHRSSNGSSSDHEARAARAGLRIDQRPSKGWLSSRVPPGSLAQGSQIYFLRKQEKQKGIERESLVLACVKVMEQNTMRPQRSQGFGSEVRYAHHRSQTPGTSPKYPRHQRL